MPYREPAEPKPPMAVCLPLDAPWSLVVGGVIVMLLSALFLTRETFSCEGGRENGSCTFASKSVFDRRSITLRVSDIQGVTLDSELDSEGTRHTRFAMITKSGEHVPSWASTSTVDKHGYVAAYEDLRDGKSNATSAFTWGFGAAFGATGISFGLVWILAAAKVGPRRYVLRGEAAREGGAPVLRVMKRRWGTEKEITDCPLAADLVATITERDGAPWFSVTSERANVTITIAVASSSIMKRLPRLEAEVAAMVRHFNSG